VVSDGEIFGTGGFSFIAIYRRSCKCPEKTWPLERLAGRPAGSTVYVSLGAPGSTPDEPAPCRRALIAAASLPKVVRRHEYPTRPLVAGERFSRRLAGRPGLLVEIDSPSTAGGGKNHPMPYGPLSCPVNQRCTPRWWTLKVRPLTPFEAKNNRRARPTKCCCSALDHQRARPFAAPCCRTCATTPSRTPILLPGNRQKPASEQPESS